MCCMCMTGHTRTRLPLLVASLLDASSMGVSGMEVPGCASGVRSVQLRDSSPGRDSVSFANLCDLDISDGSRMLVKKKKKRSDG